MQNRTLFSQTQLATFQQAPLPSQFIKVNYYLQDRHGNSPALQAAQPRTRLNAVENLAKTIEAGTIKYQEATTHTALVGKLPDHEQPLYFNEYLVAGDHNCGFTALGTSREAFYNNLIPLADTDLARNFLAEEIANALLAEDMPLPHSQTKTLLQNYYHEQVLLDELTRDAKKSLAFALSEEVLRYTPAELYLHLLRKFPIEIELSQNEPELSGDKINAALAISHADLIGNSLQQLEESRKAFIDHCAEPDMYRCYLLQLKNTKLWLGNKTALLFAVKNDIALYIWSRSAPLSSELKLEDHSDPVTAAGDIPKKVIHILHTNSFTHYNVLIEASQPSPQYSKRIEIYTDHSLNDVNHYRHNLLHRAVRSVAANKLTRFLIEQRGFKDRIDEVDIYNKTALHRAIKYFAVERDNLIQQLSLENNPKVAATHLYYEIALDLFKLLVEAGADLNKIKDADGYTVLERAKLYNKYFQWLDAKFDLSIELQNMKGVTPVPVQLPASSSTPSLRSIFSQSSQASSSQALVPQTALLSQTPVPSERVTRPTQRRRKT